MKRKELLLLPELKVTEKMKRTVREDKGHTVTRYNRPPIDVKEWYWFYRTKKTKDVLEIAVFTRGMICTGEDNPAYRVFLLKDNRYYTWDNMTDKWLTAKIDNLQYPHKDRTYWYSNKYIWIEETDRKRIADFCGEEEPRAAISAWQNYSKNRKELDAIDSEMALVPKIPKDFNEFVDREVLPQFIFYDAGRNVKTGHCTHCGREVEITNPHYGTEGRCPRCKTKIVYKTRKKSGNIGVEGYAGLLQKTQKGYVYRHFECYRKYENGQKADGGYWETIRVTYTPQFKKREEYEFGRYKQTDWIRWCNRRYWYSWNAGCYEHKTVLYSRNLKRIIKGSPMEYSAIERFVHHDHDREEMYPERYIASYQQYPCIEQLVKCGFYKLVKGLMEGWTQYLDTGAKGCKKVLNVGTEYYKMLSGKNPTRREYEVVYEAYEAGVRLTWQQVQVFSRHKRNFAIYIRHTTPHKMERYVCEVLKEGRSITQEYHDYLQMAAGLGYSLEDEWVLFPKNLSKRHAELVEEDRERKEKIEKMEDVERDKVSRKVRKKAEYLQMESDRYLLRLPKKVDEIRREGQEMHHCVATYITQVVEGKTNILFLREKENPEQPFYTMEVRDGKVIQCRAKYNGEMTEDVKAFVKQFEKTKLKQRKVG